MRRQRAARDRLAQHGCDVVGSRCGLGTASFVNALSGSMSPCPRRCPCPKAACPSEWPYAGLPIRMMRFLAAFVPAGSRLGNTRKEEGTGAMLTATDSCVWATNLCPCWRESGPSSTPHCADARNDRNPNDTARRFSLCIRGCRRSIVALCCVPSISFDVAVKGGNIGVRASFRARREALQFLFRHRVFRKSIPIFSAMR